MRIDFGVGGVGGQLPPALDDSSGHQEQDAAFHDPHPLNHTLVRNFTRSIAVSANRIATMLLFVLLVRPSAVTVSGSNPTE